MNKPTIKKVLYYIGSRFLGGVIAWGIILGVGSCIINLPDPPPRTVYESNEDKLRKSVINECKSKGGTLVKEYYEGFWSTYETMRCSLPGEVK